MDSIANQIFKNKKFDKEKLLKFGFKSQGQNLIFKTKILDDQFELTCIVKTCEEFETKFIDMVSGDLYTLHLVDSAEGTFVGNVREAYDEVLTRIAEECCDDTYFVYPQANRIADLIRIKYNDMPEFLWEKFPGNAIFRNPDSGKWYALILPVDKSKFYDGESGEVEILGIKLNKDKISELLQHKGFYPAYHMNKKSWITIILDNTVDDKTIMDLIEESHKLSAGKKNSENGEWIVPANPKYFDLHSAFKENKEIIWKQSSNVTAGDIVYLYVTSPVSAIQYKCKVKEVNIPYDYEDQNLKIKKAMRIMLLKEYDEKRFSFKILNNYGINAVRGPRNMPEDLSKIINKKE